MIKVSIAEAEAQLSSLLDRVERGEEVVITRHGRSVAKLVPATTTNRVRIDQAIASLKAQRVGSTLGGLSWRDLRDEGRR